MAWGFGSSGHQGGAYQSMVGPGYSYAVISSATDTTETSHGRRCSVDRRCSRDHSHGDRRLQRDCGHCHYHEHQHDHCHDHPHDHKPRRSREHIRTSTEHRRSREHTLSDRDSSEASRPQYHRERAGTGPFGSFAAGLTLPKSTLAKSAVEMSDFEGVMGTKNTKVPTAPLGKNNPRTRGNTYNSLRRRSGSGASATPAAAPPMTIRKKSSNIPNGRVMPRGTNPRELTVNLNYAAYCDARDVQKNKSNEKKRGRGTKLGVGGL